jgi:hypothetical protein
VPTAVGTAAVAAAGSVPIDICRTAASRAAFAAISCLTSVAAEPPPNAPAPNTAAATAETDGGAPAGLAVRFAAAAAEAAEAAAVLPLCPCPESLPPDMPPTEYSAVAAPLAGAMAMAIVAGLLLPADSIEFSRVRYVGINSRRVGRGASLNHA